MKLQRRLAIHFTYQLAAYSILVVGMIVAMVLVMVNVVTREEIKRNFPVNGLESIVTGTYFTNGEIQMSKQWQDVITERNAWLQVVDVKGNVIFEVNTNGEQPQAYTLTELVNMQDKKQGGPYHIETFLDDTYSSPLFFLLGYENSRLKGLAQLHEQYGSSGLVLAAEIPSVERKLKETGSYLTIVDPKGEELQAIGEKEVAPRHYDPLEVIAMRQSPGAYDTTITIYSSEEGAPAWILHTPNSDNSGLGKWMYGTELWQFALLVACILLFSLALSVWHGYRYARPLLLFTGWFERMEKGLYEEVLTPKDRRKLFRRRGQLKLRYRLYKEVLQSFYSMAEQLAQTEKDRVKLEQMREEWMSGISHDLRTPLSTIQGYGYILESSSAGSWSEDELRDMGTQIREKGEYMLELITDFSHISELKQQHTAGIIRSRVELSELLRVSVLAYVNDATLSAAQFRYEGEEAPLLIYGNEKWLQRLFENLLSNAVKHNPSDVIVSVSSGMVNDEVYIRVEDNGVGMDAVTRQKLFERYYRGTNTEESTEGTGLGMSIAKMVVEAHDGRIEVHSEAGEGTRITVYLPAA
ncbi:sensor histidine kinase [Paenibacillus radicis (ex Gao et al. 2016)]|uniref:histidine kinase n=1 Tax=Paenibacillus radicis (ex Gao et al. 2016) TaxID=1737354 RepID=A0A917H8Z2_9BACL|nr:HAMP domain-containing sensor histidine kinase [Paenibacillus radicis (ex Gao et al. 2016)]GGG71425.1 two-component sensor histidine kinase [Paenibacillus radicis (ex Gao et al. 2016)]